MHQLGDALIQYAIEQCAGLTLRMGVSHHNYG